jgi:hypothetical protein
MESCIVAAGSSDPGRPDPWRDSGGRRRIPEDKPRRPRRLDPDIPGADLVTPPLRIEAMHLSCYHAFLRVREANLRRKRLPCLKCGKRFWTTRCHRICAPCQALTEMGL